MLFTKPQVIAGLTDARIAAYRDLRDRDLSAEGRFITEGALLAKRLLLSRFEVESMLVTSAVAPGFIEHMEQERSGCRQGGSIPLFVADAALVRRIAGFDFHRGVLAIGRRQALPDARALVAQTGCKSQSYIACPGTATAENLGMILRSAAAFGLSGALLPHTGADPFSRRCLRQSMGSALTVSLARSADMLGELHELRASGFRLVAAVAAENARTAGRPAAALSQFQWPSRWVLLLGHEFSGLEASWLEACDDFVTIPLAAGCDSLNVAVAAGLLLYAASQASAASP